VPVRSLVESHFITVMVLLFNLWPSEFFNAVQAEVDAGVFLADNGWRSARCRTGSTKSCSYPTGTNTLCSFAPSDQPTVRGFTTPIILVFFAQVWPGSMTSAS
jgi:hypothetical protein